MANERKTIRRWVLKVLSAEYGQGVSGYTITAMTSLRVDLQFDEIDVADMLMEIENRFDIRIEWSEASPWLTVGDIIETVCGHVMEAKAHRKA